MNSRFYNKEVWLKQCILFLDIFEFNSGEEFLSGLQHEWGLCGNNVLCADIYKRTLDQLVEERKSLLKQVFSWSERKPVFHCLNTPQLLAQAFVKYKPL